MTTDKRSRLSRVERARQTQLRSGGAGCFAKLEQLRLRLLECAKCRALEGTRRRNLLGPCCLPRAVAGGSRSHAVGRRRQCVRWTRAYFVRASPPHSTL